MAGVVFLSRLSCGRTQSGTNTLHCDRSLQTIERLDIQVLPAMISTAPSSQDAVGGFDMIGMGFISGANCGIWVFWFNPFNASMLLGSL